jgi:hypothetical protein
MIVEEKTINKKPKKDIPEKFYRVTSELFVTQVDFNQKVDHIIPFDDYRVWI